jgi:purine-nucleoside phosphorylase
MDYKEKVVEAASFIKEHLKEAPGIGLLTGTGLGDTAKIVNIESSLSYSEIPHFPVSTVKSHTGSLILGKLHGKQVIAFQGRFHLYEGYSPYEVTFPIRVMQELGVKILILSNASGGLDPGFKPGDVMIIEDQINLSGHNPLVGPNSDEWGDRFPDMIYAYDKEMSSLAEQAATLHQIPLRKGVYVGLKGPSLETPAEVKFLKIIGAKAVGFSTVLEVIAAVHAKIRVLGLSIITNVHHPEEPAPAPLDEIINMANKSGPFIEKMISYVVKHIDIA